MAESIHENAVVDILLRLPAKSLVRCKCVCKQWRSLISEPGFAKSHLQMLKAGDLIPSQRIIIHGLPLMTVDYEALDGGGEGRVVAPHVIKPLGESRIVGSCDGLVCFITPFKFLIYNPTTGEYIELPVLDLDILHQAELFHGFGDKSFCGFGYDSQSDDYKIVAADVFSDGNWEVAIFSLKSGSWRRIEVQFRKGKVKLSGQGVYWKGAFHWHGQIDDPRKDVIMSFDLSEEKFHQVLPVPEVDGGVLFIGLGIHGANLFIYQDTRNNDCIEAWITNEYGRGRLWTKWFSVSTKRIPGYKYWQTIPVAYTRSGKIVFLIEMGKMILFNPKDNTCKDYPIRRRDGYVESAIYLETLVSP